MGFFNRLRRMDWRVIMLGACAVGILHIIATFAAAQLGETTAYRTLAGNLPLHKMRILPAVTDAAQPVAFMPPSVRYAICRYDTSKGPVEIKALLPDNTWSLALHTPTGDNIFTATGRKSNRSVLSLKLVPSSERFAGITPEALGLAPKPEAELMIAASSGIAIIRAPLKGQSYDAAVAAQLAKATCKRANPS